MLYAMSLAYKDTDFKNKVQIGTVFQGYNGDKEEVFCFMDLELLKIKAIKYCESNLEYYNSLRQQMGLSDISVKEAQDYVADKFNKQDYAVPFSWAGGYILFIYRSKNEIFLASQPFENQNIEIMEPTTFWQKFRSLFN